jgi:hypothetical protein
MDGSHQKGVVALTSDGMTENITGCDNIPFTISGLEIYNRYTIGKGDNHG